MNAPTNQEDLSLENKRAHWDKIIEDYLSSGLKQRAYARQHHLKHEHISYYYKQWKKRHTDSTTDINFIPVSGCPLPTHVASSSSHLELRLLGGLSISIPADFNEHVLMRLMSALRGVAC